MDNLIDIILNDIINNKDFAEYVLSYAGLDVCIYHFGIGIYVRNKYIWNNPDNHRILSSHYKVDHPDDISSKLLTEAIAHIKKRAE